MTRHIARLFVVFGLAAALLPIGCAEPPLARVNPNDEFGSFDLRLVASRDTVSAMNPIVVLRVVNDPPFAGYQPAWSTTPAGALVHEGDGVFRAVSGPFTSVLVTARFLGTAASYTIIRTP